MISYDKRTRPVLIFSKNYYYNSSSTPSLSHAGYKSKRPNEVFIPHPLRRVFKRFKNGSHTLLSGSHKKKHASASMTIASPAFAQRRPCSGPRTHSVVPAPPANPARSSRS